MKNSLLLLLAIYAAPLSLRAQAPAWQPAPGHTQLTIWPSGAPGAPATSAPEADMTKPTDNLIAGKPLIRLGNVAVTTITLYSQSGVNTGAAVAVFPGGAYRVLAIDLEGTEVCAWLNAFGITCVLLKYRVPDSGPYPKPAALQDAQRALGIVRAHAAEWHIDPKRVGVLGFSAGAHLAAALSTHFDQRLYDPVDDSDKFPCRPDFAVIVYPGYLALAEQNFAPNPEIKVTDKTPPTFIVQAEDDPVHVENALVYYQSLKNAKVPAHLRRRRPRLRPAPHRASRVNLAQIRRTLAAHHPRIAVVSPPRSVLTLVGTACRARSARVADQFPFSAPDTFATFPPLHDTGSHPVC
jgi:acetyl esterase/lipase